MFSSAYVKTMTMDKAVTGFESSGLWPFSPDKIPDEEYIASLVTDEPQPLASRTSTLPSDPMSSATVPTAVVTEPAATT